SSTRSAYAQARPTAFNNGRKVTVTAKFATQLVAPETASAAPRIWLGNISPSKTLCLPLNPSERSEGRLRPFVKGTLVNDRLYEVDAERPTYCVLRVRRVR